MSDVLRAAAAYFAIQGVAVSAWWALLLLAPGSRGSFLAPGTPDAALFAFGIPDLVLIVGGSLLASLLCARRSRGALAALCVVAGSVSYASLYCLALSLRTDSAWLGAALMLPAMLISVSFTAALFSADHPLFRRAAAAPTSKNLARTAVQILLVWSTTLLLVPAFLLHVEQRVGIARVHFSGQILVGAGLFVLASAANLWTGFTLTSRGHGTPLPLAGPRRLVTVGPYAHVRNPMALAGLGQGAAVGVGLGSPLVLGYVALGAMLWQQIARPLEEEDLARQFGPEYDEYRREVRCWWPRLRPFESGRVRTPMANRDTKDSLHRRE